MGEGPCSRSCLLYGQPPDCLPAWAEDEELGTGRGVFAPDCVRDFRKARTITDALRQEQRSSAPPVPRLTV